MAKLLPKQYARILFDLTESVASKDLDSAIRAYLLFLKEECVLTKIESIVKEFVMIAKKESGIKQLTITTARELSAPMIKKAAAAFGEKTEVTTIVDSKLIGGIIIRDGDLIFDASVKSQLKKMRQML